VGYKDWWQSLLVRGEPPASRINAQKAEQLYWSLSPGLRWGLRKAFPYVLPPTEIGKKGFAAPGEMYFDNSLAAARLRSFALYQIDKLWQRKQEGYKVIGLVQDVGQLLPFLLASGKAAWFSFDTLGALFASTAQDRHVFQAAERTGMRRESCPIIKACIGLLTEEYLPSPDIIIAQTGASCDDHAVQMQLKEWLGYHVHWMELPYRRSPQSFFRMADMAITSSGVAYQKDILLFYRDELATTKCKLEEILGERITVQDLRTALCKINTLRRHMRYVLHRIAAAERCPLPASDQLLLHVAAMDCYGDYEEILDITKHIGKLIERRDRNKTGVLPKESKYTPHFLWMLPVIEMNVPSMLENVGGRVIGWEMPHLVDNDYRMDVDPLTAIAEDYLNFRLLGDCQQRLAWLKKYLATYHVDGVIYSSTWSCTQMPIQAGIVKDYLTSYNIPMLILDGGMLGGNMSGQVRTRIEAFVENIPPVLLH
jgi:benzoyl-CoA reductase/2-hydroxyglutaryl-CoA dehydratase subunit BcrC/BadD/HgdB